MNSLKSSFIILNQHHIIIEYHQDTLNLNSYLAFKTSVFKHPLYSNSHNILVNFKNVNFQIDASEVEKFADFINQSQKNAQAKKVAFITKTPNQFVPTTIYKIKQNNPTYAVEIFSTYESALKWLKSDLCAEQLDTIFKDLKATCN